MFKKIEIWILYLTIILSILFSVFFGVLVRQELVGKAKLGWVSKTALFLAEIPVKTKILLKGPVIDLIVEDRFPSLDAFDGKPNFQESYLLLSRYDGNLRKSLVELVDLRNFQILHTWNPNIDAFNDLVEQVDEYKYLSRDNNNLRAIIRHPNLTTNGDLLFNTPILRSINPCSKLVFQNTHDIFHHSIEKDIDGNLWGPSYIYPQSLPINHVGRNIIQDDGFIDDGIVKLSSDGEILFEKSVSQILIDNGFEYLLFSVGGHRVFDQDPTHLNDIQPVNYSGDFWKKGDVFLSLRHQSMVLLYRPTTNKIIWKGTGPFFHQHDINILNDHSISIFNNNSKDFVNGDIVDGHNEVIIYDFKTNEYSSYLKESLIENEVRTITQGRSDILQNGDLFIEETDYGRTLYLNSDGSLRWTHVNRADDGIVYAVGWSRILHTLEDIKNVRNFLTNKTKCNE